MNDNDDMLLMPYFSVIVIIMLYFSVIVIIMLYFCVMLFVAVVSLVSINEGNLICLSFICHY